MDKVMGEQEVQSLSLWRNPKNKGKYLTLTLFQDVIGKFDTM